MQPTKKRRTQLTQLQQAVQEDAAGQQIRKAVEDAEHVRMLKRAKMRADYIAAGVKALKSYGYESVSAENICKDTIFKSFFAVQVQEALEAARLVPAHMRNADVEAVLSALLQEMNFAERRS